MLVRVKIGVIAAGLLACPGCSEQNPGPQPGAVQPDRGLRGQVTPIRILGRGFRPRFRANFDDKENARVESDFGAVLGATRLLEVKLVGSGELTARVPGSVPVGTHSLTVIDPDGLQGVLDDAFTVVDPSKPDARPGDGQTDGPRPDGPPADTGEPDLVPDQTPPDLPDPDLKKPLGTFCSHKNECISGHCVKVPYTFVKVCCFQDCESGDWSDGCSVNGAQCIDG